MNAAKDKGEEGQLAAAQMSNSAAPAMENAPSIIPPRKPKKPGMPKLQLPQRPTSSSAAVTPGHEVSPSGGFAFSNPAASTSQPSLHLAIPVGQSFSNLNREYEDGAETIMPGLATNKPGQHSSIYPETILGGTVNPYSMTNDLRRAIGKVKLDDAEDAAFASQPMTASSSASGGDLSALGGDGRRRLSSFEGSSSGETSASGSGGGGGGGGGVSGTSTARDLEEVSELDLRGNLEKLDRLGEGASGEVRKARFTPTGMIVAMKTINTSPNPAVHKQILRELSFNRTCHSEYIVKYYGAYLADEDTSIVICMEHCEAGSLDSIYKRVKQRNGRMGEKILAKIAESVLKGLEYLHERKIIHRDIKPSNILVTRPGQIKLCDFGVSGELINSMAGTFTGTSFYMAPERIKGEPYNITSDVWSLGLTILELASNRFPFPAEGEPPLGPIDLLSYVVTMKVPELKDDTVANIKWTRAFKDFLDHCLQKDGRQRYGPVKMLNHPWIKKAVARIPQPDVGRFVAEVWGWPQEQEIVAENIDVPGLGRVASVRKAPTPMAALSGNAVIPAGSGVPNDLGTKNAADLSRRPTRHAGLSILVEKGAVDACGIDESGRTPQDRVKARQREASVGLVGSPTQDDA